MEPPITIAIDVVSMKASMPAALSIAHTISAFAAISPITVAISMLTPSGCFVGDSETNPSCKQSVNEVYTLTKPAVSDRTALKRVS